MPEPLTRMLNGDLEAALGAVERKLREYGLGHWRLTLVARNPDPAKPGEWTVLTLDDPKTVARLLDGMPNP